MSVSPRRYDRISLTLDPPTQEAGSAPASTPLIVPDPISEPITTPSPTPTVAADIAIQSTEMHVDLQQFRIQEDAAQPSEPRVESITTSTSLILPAPTQPPQTTAPAPVASPPPLRSSMSPISPTREDPENEEKNTPVYLNLTVSGLTGFTALEGTEIDNETSGFLASDLLRGYSITLTYDRDHRYMTHFELSQLSQNFLTLSETPLLGSRQTYSGITLTQDFVLPWVFTPSLIYSSQQEASYHATADDEIQVDRIWTPFLGVSLKKSFSETKRSNAGIYFRYFTVGEITTSEYVFSPGSQTQYGLWYQIKTKNGGYQIGTDLSVTTTTQSNTIMDLTRRKLLLKFYFTLPDL